MAIKICIKDQSPKIVHQTLEYCQNNKLYNATDFKDIFKHLNASQKSNVPEQPFQVNFSLNEDLTFKINIKPEIRDMEVYKAILSKQQVH